MAMKPVNTLSGLQSDFIASDYLSLCVHQHKKKKQLSLHVLKMTK